MAAGKITVAVQRVGHPKLSLHLHAGTPIDLLEQLREALGAVVCDAHHIKCLYKGKHVDLEDGTVIFPEGAKVACILANKAATGRIAATTSPNDRVPSMEQEYERARKRASTSGRSDKMNPRIGALETFKYPETATPTPSAADAKELLRKVATDPGIVYLMEQNDWTVGVLSELPPDGYVGISPVCVLGLNLNKGAEIKLRLRTDDLRGLRKYHSIIDTMLHELAHNVHEGHGTEFKELHSTLKKAYERFMRSGSAVIAPGAIRANEWNAAPQTTKRTSGTHPTTKKTVHASPRDAAAQAALARANPNAQSFPILGDFAERELVTYFNKRSGQYVDAIITGIDRTIVPHSYTIDLYENGVDQPPTSVGRETEATRLSKNA